MNINNWSSVNSSAAREHQDHDPSPLTTPNQYLHPSFRAIKTGPNFFDNAENDNEEEESVFRRKPRKSGRLVRKDTIFAPGSKPPLPNDSDYNYETPPPSKKNEEPFFKGHRHSWGVFTEPGIDIPEMHPTRLNEDTLPVSSSVMPSETDQEVYKDSVASFSSYGTKDPQIYFEQGVGMLKEGAHRCFSNLEDCRVQDQEKLKNIVERLRTLVDGFYLNHVRGPHQCGHIKNVGCPGQSCNNHGKSSAGNGAGQPGDSKTGDRERIIIIPPTPPSNGFKKKHEDDIKGIKTKVEELHEAYVRSTGEKEIEDMKLDLEVLKDFDPVKDLIGGTWTYLAMKSYDSFIIGTKKRGLKVFENGIEVYSEKYVQDNRSLTDLIYIDHLNCYLMDYDNKIYRKDIDNQPPYFFMKCLCGLRIGASFSYSRLHKRLIVSKNYKNISAINLDTRKIEIEVKKTLGTDIFDFVVFGRKQNRVIAVSKEGHLLLYRLDFGQKTGINISHTEVRMLEGRREQPQSVAINGKNDVVLLEIGENKNPLKCSRVAVFELKGDSLTKKACIDQYHQGIGAKVALQCYGYVGRFVVWVGLSVNKESLIQVYVYDTVNGDFKELINKRKRHEEFSPAKMQRIGNQFYYTGHYGKVVCLTVNV